MAFKMKFSKDQLKGPEPVPPGIYTVRFDGFKPKLSKDGNSINLNAQVSIINNPNFDNKKLFAGLNSKIPSFMQDFVHSFGLEMEEQLSDNPSIPGNFDGDPAAFRENDPSTWKYVGPLLGRTAQWEVSLKEYQGNVQNDIVSFICAVDGCASRFPEIKHSKDMRQKS